MVRKRRIYRKGVPGSEYDAYHGTEEQKKRRAERNAARAAAMRRGTVHKGDSKEVDHLGSHRTGSLARVRTRVVSRAANRRRQPKRS